MRRPSLIGPLLLILIGALFLLRNLRPDLVSFELIANYWPIVLIGWGLIRLVEILLWWLTSKPLPAHGISGGEWVLIVLICLVGYGISSAQRHGPRLTQVLIGENAVNIFGRAYDFPISEQKPAAGVSRIVIENLRGNTRIVGADTQEIKVEGRKTIRAFEESEADQANAKTALEIVPQEDSVVVRTNQEQIAREQTISADLELTVPQGVSIQAKGRSGNFDVVNIKGDVQIDANNAEVRLQDIGGKATVDLRRSDLVRAVNVKDNVEILGRGRDVELENIGGDIVINGYYSGELECRKLAKPLLFQSGQTELRVERVPGKLDMDLGHFSATNVVGPIRLTGKNRDVQIQDFTNTVALSVERGDINLLPGHSPTGEIDAVTRNGNIELTLPASAKFQLAASASRGEVNNDFGTVLEAKAEGQGASLTGSTGGGPMIKLTVRRGSITVRKSR
jgi:DUF4097 and DUF4098 domain-containing protein YvlB